MFFQHLQLNEITVTGLTGKVKPKEMPTPISTIKAKELRQTTATNIIDAIARKPGMAQVTTGIGISKPIIRGLGYNRIVTVSDGVRQEGQQWGDDHGIEIDASSIGSIEILKGPASLMYGSDAMAGVLIFHPSPITPEGQIRIHVDGEYQTNNGLAGYSANAEGNQKGLVWNLRWSQKAAHAYQNKEDGYVPGSQIREKSLSGLIGINRSWGHSHLRLGYYNMRPGIVEGKRDTLTGQLVSEQTNPRVYDLALPFQDINHYKAIWDNIFYLHNDGQIKAIVGYQQNRRQEFEDSKDESELYFILHTTTYDVRYTHTWQNGWKMASGIGGMGQQSLNQGEEVLIPAYRLFDIGAFATASRQWNHLSMSGGLRIDHRQLHSEELEEEDELRFEDFRRHFEGVSGSLGGVYSLSDGIDLRLNIAKGFRAPNISELGSNGVHEGTMRYEQGNHQLKAEYSWQADLGADFNSQYFSAQLSLFANRIENYIFAARINDIAQTGYLTYQYQQGDARLLGFEAGIDIHPVHSLHIENTFSYVDAQQLHQTEDTRYLPMTPAPRWTFELKQELTHEGRLLSNSYISVSTECYFRQNHYYKSDQTETATPSYALLNLSAGADVMWRGRKIAECYVAVQNIGDVAYQSHLSRLKYTDINVITGRQGILNMGRNIAFKLHIPLTIKHRKEELGFMP
ncbi:MAG: TonB-dependent receptor [Bacteroidales bacterium]|nr:TonB-dependent receptor [Bacteroidales bacterium]